MRHTSLPSLAFMALAAVVLLTVPACTPTNEDRLSALEAEVAALKEHNSVNREELAQVRKNLEAIQDLLNIDQGRARLKQDMESKTPPSEDSLDGKAKDFVDKNLDRLLELTKKLLDKMEKELDEQFDKMEQPDPTHGDEI